MAPPQMRCPAHIPQPTPPAPLTALPRAAAPPCAGQVFPGADSVQTAVLDAQESAGYAADIRIASQESRAGAGGAAGRLSACLAGAYPLFLEGADLEAASRELKKN